MFRRIKKTVSRRLAVVTAGLLLAAVMPAVLAAAPASATASVVSYWGSTGYEFGDLCGTTWDWQQGAHPVDLVYNPCSGRVWVHYVNESTGQVQGYCVNPDGGLAYAIPSSQLDWTSTTTYSDLQLTSNTAPCDTSSTAIQVVWANGEGEQEPQSHGCAVGTTMTMPGFQVENAVNSCDERVWFHENSDGTGNTYCLSPQSDTGLDMPGVFKEGLVTGNQASCSAGNPSSKYPY